MKPLVAVLAAGTFLCGCNGTDPEVQRRTELSNSTPAELHEALFAPAQTNASSPEHRALTSRVGRAVSDYEEKKAAENVRK